METTVACQQLQQPIEEAVCRFDQDPDLNHLLEVLRRLVLGFIEKLVAARIEQLLLKPEVLARLKTLAAKSALRFKGYKPTSVRLLTGERLPIRSPYFARVANGRKRGRKRKKRRAKTGRHVGLSYIGLFERTSLVLASTVVQAALLCPSFELARKTLASSGIALDVKTIRRLLMSMGAEALGKRPQMALSPRDQAAGRTLLACIDGGRLRERIDKKGRPPKAPKRRGYHTDWREPTQLVIQWLDPDRSAPPPIYDATMADTDGAFALLEDYLRRLDASKAELVIFCADGAPKYWRRFNALAKKLRIEAHLEIIDYTHAKQNLNQIVEKLPKTLDAKTRGTIAADWKNLLWRGEIAELGQQIRQQITGRKARKEAMTKFKNYFLQNHRRMQYAALKHLGLPTGSGCVESAIRRVINLRLKSAGMFWKRKTAEAMLYLRSTLLCGRWQIMLGNLAALLRGEF